MKHMKKLSSYLTEKLLINKNFKYINANNEFYEKFKDELKVNSEILWFKAEYVENIIPSKISIGDKTSYNKIKEFFNTKDIKYVRAVAKNFKKTCKLYYDILKFIDDNKDSIEFFYINEKMNGGDYVDYLIYLFKAGKIKVAVWGDAKIVENNNKATIVFQYI